MNIRPTVSAFRLPAVVIIAFLTSLPEAPARTATPAPIDCVNPFVGSDEHGHTYPGATVPFGMVQLSPDTPKEGWDGSSGYYYSDTVIRGFSHTHLSGTGVGCLGDVLLMPTAGSVRLKSELSADGYWSRFSHAREKAAPGYYRVFLQDPGVTAELTATARAGFHKYTFPASNNAHIVLDLEHGIGNSPVQATLQVENSSTLSGSRISNGWGGRRAVYFVMQFSRPFDSFGIEQNGQRAGGEARTASARNVKAFVNYKTKANEAILVKVGISGTGIEGARKNLMAEIPAWDFKGVCAAARRQWSEALNAVEFQSADAKVRRTFYSNLYLSYLSPVLFNDVDGSYRGVKENQSTNSFQNYTTFSLWDTFRAEHPLLTILQPQRVPDMVNSMLAHYAQFGQNALPVWPLWGNETWTMIGYHSAPVIADAYLKGFRGFDAEAAYQALRATALDDRNGQDEYRRYGYVLSSSNGQKQSVSRTLEYAYDDWCIAQLAQALGHTQDAQMFLQRAASYRNVFDATTGFMRGRKADGSWRARFNAKQLVWADYTEANAWQYSWTAMQDVPDLIRIMGGDEAFIAKLEKLFNEKPDVIANIPDITGLIGQYAHGNEPVHHVAYLYSYAGAPYKTQQRVRQIMATLYNDTPAGQPGNNDCGQMSAWYVFSALGFYPVNPVGGVYVIGSPLCSRAVLHLDKAHYGGRSFTVIAANNSPKNIYIQSATLNGQALNRSWLTHAEMTAGGVLRLAMGPQPNVKWGQAMAERPPSGMPAGFQYAALPAPSSDKPVILSLPIRVVAGSDEPVQGFVPDPNLDQGAMNFAPAKVDISAAGAAPAAVYQSELYGSDFALSYPVPREGRYQVRLHFAEIFDDGAGQRIENVAINGKTLLRDFDIFAAAGGMNKAVVKEFSNISPNAEGRIVIHITAAPQSPDQNAKISAIEISRL